MAKWDFAWILTLERKWKTQGWMPLKFVKGRLNFSCKSTTAANVDLTESLLDNWLKNNHITVDKIYYLRSLFVFFTNFSFQIYFSTAENRHRNRTLLQLAKIRLEWISQSNGSIGRPLGFAIDRLNTSLYRIAPCLRLRNLVTEAWTASFGNKNNCLFPVAVGDCGWRDTCSRTSAGETSERASWRGK